MRQGHYCGIIDVGLQRACGGYLYRRARRNMPSGVLIKFDIMRSCLIGVLAVFGSFLHRGISAAA